MTAELNIPDAAFAAALNAWEPNKLSANEQCRADVIAAAPLIVAAELRRLAEDNHPTAEEYAKANADGDVVAFAYLDGVAAMCQRLDYRATGLAPQGGES